MTNPGNVRDEIKKLSDGIRAMKAREEAEEAYVLMFTDGSVSHAARSLKMARFWSEPGDRICRLEPVETRS